MKNSQITNCRCRSLTLRINYIFMCLSAYWQWKFSQWARENFCSYCTKIAFAQLRYTIGLKKWRHLSIQSQVRPKPIATRSHTFSRAPRQLHTWSWNVWLVYLIVCIFLLRLAGMITFVLVLGLKNRSNGIENQTKFSFAIFCQFKENQHDPTQYSRFILNLLLASKRWLSLRNVKTWRGHRKRLSPFLLPGLPQTRQDQIEWIQFCSNETV